MNDTLRKKKVLLIITKSNWGGAQRYVHDLALGLPKDRYEITVALGGEGPLKDKLVAAGIRAISIPGLQRDINPFKEIRVFFFLWNFMRTERFDIVHLNSSKIGGLGVVAARLALIRRLVFTAHGFAFNESRPGIIKLITKLLYWVMIIGSSRTILVSYGMGRDIQHWPFVQKKLAVIYNSIQPLMFRPREEARAALAHFSPALGTWMQQNPTSLLVGTIGELHHIKGHEHAITAMTSLPTLALATIGGGDDHDRLEKLIRSLNLENRVFLLGNRVDAYQYLKGLDIFLLASLSETFGYVLLEAGLAELPVIATNVGGIPEIIEHEKTGLLIPAHSPQAIEEAITQLIANPTQRSLLAHNLHEKATHDFTFDRMLTETIAVYESH